jgi:hypothetical protein
MTHSQHQQIGQHGDAHGFLTAVCVPANLVLAQPQARFQLPVHELDCPTFLVDAHDLARCQRGQIGHQDFGMLGARVTPFFTQSLFEKYQAASRLSIKRVIATYTNVSLVLGNSS